MAVQHPTPPYGCQVRDWRKEEASKREGKEQIEAKSTPRAITLTGDAC